MPIRSYRRSITALAAAALALTVSIAAAQQNGVVARVNGVDITEQELAMAEQMYAAQLGDMPADARRSLVVDALIEARLVADAARKAGVADQDDYKRQMAFFEAQTLRALYLEQEAARQVDDAALRKAYAEQVAKTPPVEEVRLRHILLPDKQAADEVIAQLKAGKDFGELAQQKSADPASKDNAGDLGFVGPGQTFAEFDAAAAALQPGEFTQQPVQSAFGFHVVKLEERRPRPAPAFEALAPQLRQQLEAEATRRVADDLRAAAKVEKLVPDVKPPAGAGGDGHQH